MENLTPEYPIVPFKEKVIPDPTPFGTSIGGLRGNTTSSTFGAGNDVYKVTAKGIHLGAAEFANAPFSVDMDGAVNASALTVTGGTITGALIRTSASGTRVEMQGSNNRIEIFNSAGTSIGSFGTAGADGNFIKIDQPDTNQDYPPVYITSAQDSNVLAVINTNSAVSNRPAFVLQSNNAVTGNNTMYINSTGSGNYHGLYLESSNSGGIGYSTLYLKQNGTDSIINTNVAGCFLSKAGVWTDASSVVLKENFKEVTVLDKLKTLDVLEYNYKVDAKRKTSKIREDLILQKKREKYSLTDAGIKGSGGDMGYLDEVLTSAELTEIDQKERTELSKEETKVVEKHFTPMAEDFNAMFGLGNDKSISPNDTAGIALQAIKELLARVEALENKP